MVIGDVWQYRCGTAAVSHLDIKPLGMVLVGKGAQLLAAQSGQEVLGLFRVIQAHPLQLTLGKHLGRQRAAVVV
jgi:hypothetical protein